MNEPPKPTSIVRILIVFCLAFLTACSSFQVNSPPSHTMTKVIPVYLDQSFSAQERASILQAVETWNQTLNSYARYEVKEDVTPESQLRIQLRITASEQGVEILRVLTTDQEAQEVGDGVLAWMNDIDGNVMRIIADRIGSRNLAAIVMHELGHQLGVYHINVKGSLMFPNYNYASDCIDELTVKSLASVHPFYDWHHMNYCKLD